MEGIPSEPDRRIVRTSYSGWRASLYDLIVKPISAPYRARAVERLALRPGETVIDLGVGTGLSLSLLVSAVSPGGRVIGVDASPDVLTLARRRVQAARWHNVELVEAFAQDFQPAEGVDAILACNVNQLLASRQVMERAVSWLKPGGSLVAAGGKGGHGPSGLAVALFVYLSVWLVQREHSAARWILHPRPWFVLEELLPSLEVETLRGDTMFVAHGVKP